MYGHGCLLSFRGNLFVICPLQHDSTLKKTFQSKEFFEKWNDNEKPKTNLRKESWERTSGTTKWDKLGQVGVRGTSGTRRRGSSDLSGTSALGGGDFEV